MKGSLQDQFIKLQLAAETQRPQQIDNIHQNYDDMVDTFNIANTRLPEDTRLALSSVIPDNFALKLNKAANFLEDEKRKFKPTLFKKGKRLNEIIYKTIFNFSNNQINSISNNHFSSIEKLGLKLECLQLEIDWRLILGLGNESVYETSITLHHIYGFPYIPASAIKGVVRSWIITELFGKLDSNHDEYTFPLVNAEHRAYSNKAFCTIFGCPKESKKVKFDGNNKPSFIKEVKHIYDIESHPTALEKEYQGAVWFFDAYPTTPPTIKVDIMNPHYGDYYSDKTGKNPPADYLSPAPIPFVTVENTSFQFIIGIKPSDNTTVNELNDLGVLISVAVGKLKQPSTLLEVVQYWLEQALMNHGIGSKTAVGYGYMKET